jgi:hypothetical protein
MTWRVNEKRSKSPFNSQNLKSNVSSLFVASAYTRDIFAYVVTSAVLTCADSRFCSCSCFL